MKNKFSFDNIKSLGAALAASSVSNDLLARQVQVSYWEAGEYFILDTHRLMCAGN